MKLLVDSQGVVHCIYSEVIDLTQLGLLSIRRASLVEPDGQGRWLADLAPVGGPCLGAFTRRSDALRAEEDWLETHWLTYLPTS